MYYIAVNKENNKMIGFYTFKPSKFNYDKLYLIEAENLPKRNSNQYLVAENITTNTRVINEETQEVEEYLTCTFKAVELPIRELTEEEKHEQYKAEVKRLIRLKYDLETELGIVNDYMSNDTNPEYVQKYQDYQDYRFECKAKARKEVYGY